MRVLFYTYGMLPGTEHLMPWRTLVEVARQLKDMGGYNAAICSASKMTKARDYEGIYIYNIEPTTKALVNVVLRDGWDVVYYPVSYRQGLKNLSELKQISSRLVAYIPGGITPLAGSLRLIRDGYWREAKPYLFDTLTPRRLLVEKLRKIGFQSLICQSPLTASDAIKKGWPKEHVFCALPGNDMIHDVDNSIISEIGLKGKRFILFSGAPAPTRGAVMALKAFDQIAGRLDKVKMVLLMRHDVSSKFEEFNSIIPSLKHKEQILIVDKQLRRDQLFGFFKAAWVVMLPFLVIPSEIPLTFFEVMSLGTPIITFDNGGTTEYLRKGLRIVNKRNVNKLAEAILDLCQNDEERTRLSVAASKIMEKHPTWRQTAEIWENAIRK